MAQSNGAGQFNVGRDLQIVLVNANTSQRIDLPNVMTFECKQDTANIKIDRLDGVQLLAELPKGWTGSFDVERAGNALDVAIAASEAAWYTSGTITNWTLYQYVTEPDGSTSTFQFDNAALKYDDAGAWKGDASVKQKVSFMANRRKKL